MSVTFLAIGTFKKKSFYNYKMYPLEHKFKYSCVIILNKKKNNQTWDKKAVFYKQVVCNTVSIRAPTRADNS